MSLRVASQIFIQDERLLRKSKILLENINKTSLSAVRSGRKSCRVNLTVLLSFEEKQLTLARAHNRDTVPLTSSLSLTLSGTCSYHLSFSPRWYFSHNFQRTTFAILSCICLYSLWTNFLHSQTICFTLSPHYLHKGDSHSLAVNMVSVTWLVLWACFWPAQMIASVWIFESAFRNQLQVFLHALFRVFLIKLTMQLFFLPTVEFQLIVPRCLQST